jgi:hypothetical protein
VNASDIAPRTLANVRAYTQGLESFYTCEGVVWKIQILTWNMMDAKCSE